MKSWPWRLVGVNTKPKFAFTPARKRITHKSTACVVLLWILRLRELELCSINKPAQVSTVAKWKKASFCSASSARWWTPCSNNSQSLITALIRRAKNKKRLQLKQQHSTNYLIAYCPKTLQMPFKYSRLHKIQLNSFQMAQFREIHALRNRQ